jgi:aerotaxis receptor
VSLHDASNLESGPRPIPSLAERPFGADESFFSTTDERGIIRSGNRVFRRVSGYTKAEPFGHPHRVIRHPDMPRTIFQIFWEDLLAGRPVAAYVKNLADDRRTR